jgi:hypothetical protein
MLEIYLAGCFCAWGTIAFSKYRIPFSIRFVMILCSWFTVGVTLGNTLEVVCKLGDKL